MDAPKRYLPSNAYGWTGPTELLPDREVTLAVGESVVFMQPDPYRIWAMVSMYRPVTDIMVWPYQQGGDYGLSPATGTETITLHVMTHRDTIGYEWYARTADPVGCIFRVVECRMSVTGG